MQAYPFGSLETLSGALAAHRAGRAAEAELLYRRVLAGPPGGNGPARAMAAGLQGRLLLAQGRAAEAEALLRHALALRPDEADVRRDLARACIATGVLDEAIDQGRAVALLRPGDAAGHAVLAAALLQAGRPAEALAAAERAAALAPAMAEAWFVAGTALRGLGRAAEAVPALEQAVRRAPGHAPGWLNLGHAEADLGLAAQAEAHVREAIRRDPGFAEAHASLGVLLTEAGRLDEAVAACDRALALRPGRAETRWHRAVALLLAGDYRRGFADFEARRLHPALGGRRAVPGGTAWDGGPLTGRTLLLRAEQGLGDSIQFARYVPGLAAMGARVMLACPAPLAPLLAQLPAAIVPPDSAVPAGGLWAELGSLPHLLGTTAQTVPLAGGYLSAPEASPSAPEVSPSAPGAPGAPARAPDGVVRVGLAWAGNPAHRNDSRRSLPPRAVAAVLAAAEAVPGLRFSSLQVGRRAGEAATLYGLADESAGLGDFAATARRIAGLDLVLTVDTAVAHLAGAMGRPVWLMLPHAPDWRWMLGRDDTPWYASMRLFRQPAPGDWSSVAARVVAALVRRYGAAPGARPGAREAASAPSAAAMPVTTAPQAMSAPVTAADQPRRVARLVMS